MLGDKRMWASLPTAEIERAAKFYTLLGLKVLKKDEAFIALEAGEGTRLFLYLKGPTKAEHTALSFDVENIENAVNELKDMGVEFEDYDIPAMEIKTENGIATMGEVKSAWFKDPDGNIIAITEGM